MREPWRSFLLAILAAVITLLGGITVMQVGGCGGVPTPPTDPGPPAPEPTPDPVKAIGKVAMGGGYCSATAIGPPDNSGTWTLVCAAHCFGRVGERATFFRRTDGQAVDVTVIAMNKTSDIAILKTTEPIDGGLPWLHVAETTPASGTAIWHSGFGVDKPGNLEKGQVLAAPNNDGQVRYRLSVSPGDSGGGICTDAEGRLLSPVCCTTRLGGVGDVWGGAPEVVRRMIAAPTEFLDLPPIAMPAPPVQMPAEKP